MKKFILSALSLMMALTMSAITYQTQVSITLDDGTYYQALVVGESDNLAAGVNNGYAGEIQNLDEMPLAIYALYGGVKYSTFSTKSYTKLPVGIKTTGETTYHLYFDDVTGTVNLYDKKVGAAVPVTEGGDYEFTISNEEKNSVINDRFYLNYVAPTVKVKGSWDNWATAVELTGDGTATADVAITGGEGYYTFKFVLDEGTAAETWLSDKAAYKRNYTGKANLTETETDAMTLWVDAKGTYTFSWTYATNTFDIAFPALPTVQMKGSWDSWADFVNFTPAADGLTASANLHLDPAGWYTFKVVLGSDDWRSFEYVDDATSAFTSTNNSHNWINANHTDNMSINADVAGDYTFTWTFVENKLEITFPSAAPVAVASVTTNTLGWATFSYNQDLVPVDASAQTLYKGAISDDVLALDDVDYVKSGEGVVVNGAPSTTYHFAAGSGSADFTGNALRPTSAYNTSLENVYVLKGDAFLKYVGTDPLAANKAFIQLPSAPAGAPQHLRMVINGPQDIESVEAENVKAEKFIEDGQIFIRRDNKVYNVQGQIVK